MTIADLPTGPGSLYHDTLELLQELIRNACVNDLSADSGHEERNAQSLHNFFSEEIAAGTVTVQRFEPHPSRVSVAFSVAGSAQGEPLTLLGHTDVVPVDEPKWTRPPFAAHIEDGKIYGRGAVDMLFITATMAAITRAVARSGTPAGDLCFVALADEEARGGLGAGWIFEHHRDAFSWANCLSETGGSHLGERAIGFNIGEKGAAQRRLHVHGDPGHGSTPFGKDFVTVKIAEVARRLAAAPLPLHRGQVWEEFISAFRFDPDTHHLLLAGELTDKDYEVFGPLAAYAHAFSHTTVSQTVLRAGGAINVLPSHAWLELDIRPFPGQSQEEVDEYLRTALGDLAPHTTIEHLISEDATISRTDTALWQVIADTTLEVFPDAEVIPVLATGGSDLRFARRAGGQAYGFALHARGRDMASANSQLHAHDEHLYLEDLGLTVHGYRRVVERFLRVDIPA